METMESLRKKKNGSKSRAVKTCGAFSFTVTFKISKIMESVSTEVFVMVRGLLILKDLTNIGIFCSLNGVVGRL